MKIKISKYVKWLNQWERQSVKQEKAKASAYFEELKAAALKQGEDIAEYIQNSRFAKIYKRDIKKLGLKKAYIKSSIRYTQEKAQQIRDLLLNKEILPLSAFCFKVEWHKSRTWGSNPSGEGWTSGGGYCGTASASGCGYDKLSAVYNSLMHQAPSIMKEIYILLLNCWKKGINNPYGTQAGLNSLYLNCGGCGASTVRRIFEALGFKDITEQGGASWDYMEGKKKPNIYVYDEQEEGN